jgi:DNA-binding Xre family transcriptional regulator
MHSTDTKILELIDLLLNTGKIIYEKDFCEAVGVLKQNLTRIKQGKAHFTAEHIKQICKVYEVNANWIFDVQKKMFNSSKASKKKDFV